MLALFVVLSACRCLGCWCSSSFGSHRSNTLNVGIRQRTNLSCCGGFVCESSICRGALSFQVWVELLRLPVLRLTMADLHLWRCLWRRAYHASPDWTKSTINIQSASSVLTRESYYIITTNRKRQISYSVGHIHIKAYIAPEQVYTPGIYRRSQSCCPTTEADLPASFPGSLCLFSASLEVRRTIFLCPKWRSGTLLLRCQRECRRGAGLFNLEGRRQNTSG